MCGTTVHIGVKLTEDQLFENLFPNTPRLKNTYSCKHRIEQYRYCPECGVKVVVTQEKNIPYEYKGYSLTRTSSDEEYMLCIVIVDEGCANSTGVDANIIDLEDMNKFIEMLTEVGIDENLSIYYKCSCYRCDMD